MSLSVEWENAVELFRVRLNVVRDNVVELYLESRQQEPKNDASELFGL